MARILLGVTGGIAAYKACELTRLLVRAGHDVVPVLTPSAERLVSADTFRALARRFEDDGPFPHLERADLLVVAPLTANTMARLASGIADTLVTQAALSHVGPAIAAPAMNPRMWANPATQANAALLAARGWELVGPEEGDTAEGEQGVGRMAEPETIFERVQARLAAGSLAGKRVLVSAGGTREPLDGVRYVGNRSSGRMGVAIAEEARRRGAQVTLLAANLAVPAPAGVEVVETRTAAEMLDAALAHADADLVVMAAAVADYRPAETIEGKRPKSGAAWSLELVPTEDVIGTLASRRRNGQVLVAFGAESGEAGLERKRRMLADKNVDLVVYNDVGRDDIGFEVDENEVVLIAPDGERRVARAPKARIAAEVLDAATRLL